MVIPEFLLIQYFRGGGIVLKGVFLNFFVGVRGGFIAAINNNNKGDNV
jgi:hypothetical protein